jgi:hypothetical protein
MAVSSCGGEDVGPCDERVGTYRFTFSERTGNCGDFEEINTFESQPVGVPATCTGKVSVSDDNCQVTNSNVACPTSAGPLGSLTLNGKYTWSKDAGSGEGSASILMELNNGNTCQSTYDVVMERL